MVYSIIYKTTNLINGKIYIGQRMIINQKTLDSNYIGSGGIHFKRAIKKYGKENFKREILCKIKKPNQFTNDKLEAYFIKKYDSMNLKVGYNKLPGTANQFGSGSPMKNPDVAARVTAQLIGRERSPHSKETKLQMSITATINWSEDEKRRIDTSKRVSSYMKNGGALNLSKQRKGVPFSESHKSNISKNHADFKGDKHPCYGIRYKWITDGVKNIRFKGDKEDIPLNFKLGKTDKIKK